MEFKITQDHRDTFGVDLNVSARAAPDTSRPVRFIFLGASRGSKGLPCARASLAGAPGAIVAALVAKACRLILHEGLRQIGRFRTANYGVLSQCDVLVFPSYSEGLRRSNSSTGPRLPIIAWAPARTELDHPM